MNGKLIVMEDAVNEALDDMAALGLHWTRNRERGRMPGGIRQAMLLVAREALAHEDAQARGELCGPAAYARNGEAARICQREPRRCGEQEIGWCVTCPKRSRV